MADKNNNHSTFLIVEKVDPTDELNVPDFAYGSEEHVNKVKARWEARKAASDDKGEPETEQLSEGGEADQDFSHESALTDALASSVDFGLSQYEMIVAAATATVVLRTIVGNERVLRPATEKGEVIEEGEHYTIYGLDAEQISLLDERRESWSQMRTGMDNFPKAIFLSQVAEFDSRVVDILKKMLKLQKDWLAKSDRALPLDRLATVETLDELMEEAIEEEIYQFSRGSHEEQAKYIRNRFGINIQDEWKRWPDYIEIFERRNLVAHGESAFNKRYVANCLAAGHKGSEKIRGNQVELTRSYLNQSIDILLEFLVLLSFSLWLKFSKESEDQAFTSLNEAVFKLIKSRHPKPAERIAAYALHLKKAKVSAETKLTLSVNRASALKHDGREGEAHALLDEIDWTATSYLFKICVAGVRGDAKGVCDLLPKLKSVDGFDGHQFVDWPCFRFVRENEEVRKLVLDLFGVNITAPDNSSVVSEKSGEEEKSDPQREGTLH
jgi:hypothetical protein